MFAFQVGRFPGRLKNLIEQLDFDVDSLDLEIERLGCKVLESFETVSTIFHCSQELSYSLARLEYCLHPEHAIQWRIHAIRPFVQFMSEFMPVCSDFFCLYKSEFKKKDIEELHKNTIIFCNKKTKDILDRISDGGRILDNYAGLAEFRSLGEFLLEGFNSAWRYHWPDKRSRVWSKNFRDTFNDKIRVAIKYVPKLGNINNNKITKRLITQRYIGNIEWIIKCVLEGTKKKKDLSGANTFNPTNDPKFPFRIELNLDLNNDKNKRCAILAFGKKINFKSSISYKIFEMMITNHYDIYGKQRSFSRIDFSNFKNEWSDKVLDFKDERENDIFVNDDSDKIKSSKKTAREKVDGAVRTAICALRRELSEELEFLKPIRKSIIKVDKARAYKNKQEPGLIFYSLDIDLITKTFKKYLFK